MRLDKFLANMGQGSRRDVKRLIAKGQVTINDQVASSAKQIISPSSDQISCNGKRVVYQPHLYLMLNKPAGLISSSEYSDQTVMTCVPMCFRHYDLFPIGRLDKDTTGLLLLSNDGALAHRLLSPKHHVKKTYAVTCRDDLTRAHIAQLEHGVVIGNHYQTKPASVKHIRPRQIELTITEGKFHQVKQMMVAVDNLVVELKRIHFAGLALDPQLELGQIRQLTATEVDHLRGL